MSRVYVTSNRFRKRDGELVPAVDLRPAEQYGSLTAVFDHAMDPSSDEDLQTAAARLRDFDEEQDYVLPSGSPMATLAVGLLLGRHSARVVQVLEWDRFALKYKLKTVSV